MPRKNTHRSAPPSSAPILREPPDPEEPTPFPIVGIGASAGGLEAIEQFLGHVPPASGLGFVVVQHLDPNYKGVLVELLQHSTTMPVIQIEDGIRVEPDHVYVIPPHFDISLLHGQLYLLEPAAPHGLRLPIDYFFRSLADDQQERSIGVILSGMGSDGTLGLRAIKEKAGGAFVQAPASAKFDGMPSNAIGAGLADVVAAAEELPARIVSYIQHTRGLLSQLAPDPAEIDTSALDKVVLLLRAHTGQDFSLYKKSTLYRRIERRMGLHQLPKITDYVRFLRENPQETGLLFKELLIGVTRFFRDPDVWEQLKAEVIPALLAAQAGGGPLRAWVPACSTGEEAYSLAITFCEALQQIQATAHHSLQIFATDLDPDAIDKARAGIYPANIAADVGDERLRRFFVQDDFGFRVSNAIREMVVFAPQNLIMDPPFTKLDLLSCRNLLIYLEADLQKKLLPLFHYSLNPSGILVLGSSETIGEATTLFAPLPGKTRIYQRRLTALPKGFSAFPSAFSRPRTRTDAASSASPATLSALSATNLQALTESLLLQHYCPAAVLTDDKGNIAYISGKTGKYLEPAPGKANLNVFAMAREGLSDSLNAAFAKAVRQKILVTIKGIAVGTEGGTQFVDLTVTPLDKPAALQDMVLIVFASAPPPAVAHESGGPQSHSHHVRLTALVDELQQCREELQITREEMQTSEEELKSANEELQSTNEELQSANEELTTSREEMQSMNEELHTVNQELQAKVDELSLASDDMKNLLNSTSIATLFLDDELRVRRFTTETSRIIKLIPGDVGRPITDLVMELQYPALAEDVCEVMRTLVFLEREVPARNDRWFRVRIMPYRTQDNRIDGAVITFVDISLAKAQEATLRDTLAALQGRFVEQSKELDQSRKLESILKKAQSILEERLSKLNA
ncbi:chemotaxis protein CheB [Niveibacterium terrae]|uniref:chemotaxis protein CheB n=1 Tax=Niveibacterium terrae TaxID=3373598 RepID=UPI003A95955F